MDRVHYAGDAFLTGTEIARALLDYAQALAHTDESDTVDIPTIDANGLPGRSEVLIGPASQLLSTFEKSDFDEVVDPELVAELAQKAQQLRRFGAFSGGEVRPEEPGVIWSDLDGI